MRDPTPTFIATLMVAAVIVFAHGLQQAVGQPVLPDLASLGHTLLGGI